MTGFELVQYSLNVDGMGGLSWRIDLSCCLLRVGYKIQEHCHE